MKKIAYPLLSFFVVAFGQPAWIRGFGVLAAAFGFALFWRGLLEFSRPRDRWVLSVIWFATVQGVQLSWMATIDYMGPLILVLYLFLIVAMGIQFGIVSLFLAQPVTWRLGFAMAGCWTLFEWMRLFFLCGFTWNPIGLALTDSPYSLQFASIWGIFGLSFWVVLANFAALRALLETSAKKMALWAVIAFLPYAFGVVHQKWVETKVPLSGTLNVALVQTALFPQQKEFEARFPTDYVLPLTQWERILAVLDFEKKLDLIVLPEAALPLGAHRAGYDFSSIRKYFPAEALAPLRAPYAVFHRGEWKVSNAFIAQSLANHFNAHVIIGLDDSDLKGTYNAAFHFQPNNLPYERYEKRVLVPVGEYIPLKNWEFFTRFIADQFGIHASFDPGEEVKIFNAHFPIGISICLEETFSHLTRELRTKGAELFVNLTNDVWFPGSKLPRQHFDHGRVRAAENGVFLLRACNTGITAAIDCFGRPLQKLPLSENKASSLYLNIPLRSYFTLYSWWGDGMIIGISILSLLSTLLFVPIRKKKLL